MTREELRDYVDEQRTLNNIPYHVYSTLIDGIDALGQESRKGSWISSNGVPYTYFNSFIVCSECGKHPKEKSDFCPNCGADMRGEN